MEGSRNSSGRTGEFVEYDEVSPDASAMIEAMRAHGYTLPSAIADLVDNSIAAGAGRVWLRFHWSGAGSWISVTDDGCGMDEDELRDAMRLGSRNPLEDRDAQDLGRFGLGLKTASLSQCRRLTVGSRRRQGPLSIRRWDLDHLAREDVQGWQLLKHPHPDSKSALDVPSTLSSGTVVLWEVLDRLVGNATKDDRRIQDHFLQLIDYTEKHLAMVFHRYLTEGRRGICIYVNGNRLEGWDPFLEDHPATQRTPEEVIPLPGHEKPIRVRGFVLPHKDKLGDDTHRNASGPGGWNAQQGFYLYRNERLIVAGSWLGLGTSRPWTKEEHYKLARIRIDIPNSMDHLWQLDVKKSTAHPPPQIRERLRRLAQAVRETAREVFAHRGKYRTGPRHELRRAWEVVRRTGSISYRIDRLHPLVSTTLADAPPDRRAQMEAMLRVIEETVPVEQIWLDMAEAPDNPGRPFQGTTPLQLRQLIQIAYDAVRRNRRLGHADAIQLLLTREEFSSPEASAIIGAIDAKQPA